MEKEQKLSTYKDGDKVPCRYCKTPRTVHVNKLGSTVEMCLNRTCLDDHYPLNDQKAPAPTQVRSLIGMIDMDFIF